MFRTLPADGQFHSQMCGLLRALLRFQGPDVERILLGQQSVQRHRVLLYITRHLRLSFVDPDELSMVIADICRVWTMLTGGQKVVHCKVRGYL